MSQAIRRSIGIIVTTLAILAHNQSAPADVRPNAGMLRYPDVGKSHIAFVYANDIWLVPREGGMAIPLASPPGQELFPKFSPDGTSIAFQGNYDGNRDLYVIPTNGGVPTRVTHHPDADMLCDWTPDGRLLFYTNAVAGLRRQSQLFTVPSTGGLPTQLPVPYGTVAAISPDGQWLAYTPHTADFRTWKRYRGGMATDIWLFNLKDKKSKKITDWEGTDTLPMWNGTTVYYLSDAGPEHKLNIWSYDTKTEKREQITQFKDLDVKWPSIGPGPDGKGEIVFQKGSELYLLDLSSRQPRTVAVTVPGDRPRIRPRDFDAAKLIAGADISPTGKRAIVEARGDIWTLPATKGSVRNLTRSSGVAERDAAWSPDGKWLAYFSDATGEYELYVRPADGKGEPTQLTKDFKTFFFNPTWSPDSKHIVFTDKAGAIYLCNLRFPADDKPPVAAIKVIDTDSWANQPRVRWSHDSNWLTYAKTGDNRLSSIWLYNVSDDKTHQVTSGMFNDSQPTFDRKGDYLFFASNRDFSKPTYEDLGTTFIYANTEILLAVPLRKDVKSPLAPKSDEESPTTQPTSQPSTTTSSAPASAPATQASTQPADIKPLVIDLEGFERRAIRLPMKKGLFGNVAVNSDGKLVYARGIPQGGDGDPSICIFDLVEDKDGKREEKTVFAGTGQFAMSADGKRMLIRKDDTMAIVEPAADQKLDKPISTDGMTAAVNPREEWRQVFNDAWRIQRDFFYDPHMHNVDWAALRERYGKMLDDCVSREDVSYVISELISELNVGHAYYRTGAEAEKSPDVPVGMLGADFVLENGAYKIARIIEGGVWDVDGRGPLSQPGLDVKAGDYLLAVNGVPVDTKLDPWAAFQGLAGKVVTLTVSSKPTMDKDAREIVVEPLPNEADLRFRNWIEQKRRYVADKTDGKIGYIYVINTGREGQNDLFRQFYGQIDKPGLIIDERWNGGGQIPTRFIELLNRPVTNYWARRDGRDWPWPPDSHQGPKCMLINGLAGSGGDCFPTYFRRSGLGKLIGMRTWGGLVGISGNPGLIDGANITVPTFGYYKTNGTWGVEGHGVDPDIEVIDDPALMTDGGDPQLDAGIKQVLTEIQQHPYIPPKKPAYPDRSGMGIPEADR